MSSFFLFSSLLLFQFQFRFADWDFALLCLRTGTEEQKNIRLDGWINKSMGYYESGWVEGMYYLSSILAGHCFILHFVMFLYAIFALLCCDVVFLLSCWLDG